MDPDITLRELRERAECFFDYEQNHHVRANAVDGMPELFQALDDWLTQGGFLPKDWNHHSPPF